MRWLKAALAVAALAAFISSVQDRANATSPHGETGTSQPAPQAPEANDTISPERPSRACEAEMMRAARKYDVPLGMLYSVGLTETGRRGSLQPYAMNVEGKAVFSNTAAEAIQKFRSYSQAGKKLIDLGCMQINHYFHHRAFPSLEAMLDPKQNVEYAAKFLKSLKTEHETWTMAIARYHAGPNNDPAQKEYVCKVIANMVATGFGQWTPNAKAFCADSTGLSGSATASRG